MSPNIGTLDRVLRIASIPVVGALVFAGALGGATAAVLALVSLALASTAFLDFCPIYRALGVSTK